jgi:hypothetical protein
MGHKIESDRVDHLSHLTLIRPICNFGVANSEQLLSIYSFHTTEQRDYIAG